MENPKDLTIKEKIEEAKKQKEREKLSQEIIKSLTPEVKKHLLAMGEGFAMLAKWFGTLEQAVKDNKTLPPDLQKIAGEVKVLNPKDFKVNSVDVKNFPKCIKVEGQEDVIKAIDSFHDTSRVLLHAISKIETEEHAKNSQALEYMKKFLVGTLQKQNEDIIPFLKHLTFLSNDPEKPLSVRLSNGEKHYEAIAQVVYAAAAGNKADFTTIISLLTSIDGKDFATETTLALLEGKDFSTETTLLAIKGFIDDLETLLTSIIKAEDSPHVSGDKGIMGLGVRRNAETPTAPDGDYHPFLFNDKGRLKTDADIDVTVGELFGFDNRASSWFEITLAGSVGDTIRVQIIAPDAVDVTSTLTATEAGDVEKTADLVVLDLNADTEFKKNWVARAICGIVTIFSETDGECGERNASSALTVAVTGTTTVNIPTNNDKIIRLNKPLEGFHSPRDNRLVNLGFRGETSSVTKASRPIFVSETDDQTDSGIVRVVSDRNFASFIITPALDDKDEVFVPEIEFATGLKGVVFRVATGQTATRGTQKTFLASQGGAGRDEYLVGDYVMKDHRGDAAPASFSNANGSVLVVEAWNGSAWVLADHTKYIIKQVFGNENDAVIKMLSLIPPSGGDGIRINYAPLDKKRRNNVGVNTTNQSLFGVPIKLVDGDFIVINADQLDAGVSEVSINYSAFPINKETGEI